MVARGLQSSEMARARAEYVFIAGLIADQGQELRAQGIQPLTCLGGKPYEVRLFRICWLKKIIWHGSSGIDRINQQVNFVQHAQARYAAGHTARDLGINLLVSRSMGVTRVKQAQHHICIVHRAPSARNADLFDLVLRFAQTRRVDDVQRNAFDLNRLLHAVACGARNRCNNRHLGTA